MTSNADLTRHYSQDMGCLHTSLTTNSIYIVCAKCGLILNEGRTLRDNFDLTEEFKPKVLKLNQVGIHLTNLLGKYSQRTTQREEHTLWLKFAVKRICSQLDVSDISEDAYYIYQKILAKTQKRLVHLQYLPSTLVKLCLGMRGLWIPNDDLAKVALFNVKDYFKNLSLITCLTGFKVNRGGIIAQVIQMAGQKLRFSQGIINQAHLIYAKHSDCLESKPLIVAGICLYLAYFINQHAIPRYITLKRVEAVLDVRLYEPFVRFLKRLHITVLYRCYSLPKMSECLLGGVNKSVSEKRIPLCWDNH